MKVSIVSLIFSFLLIGLVSISAQQPPAIQFRPGAKPSESVPTEGLARNPDNDTAIAACKLTFCTTDLNRVLVHSGDGMLVLEARSVRLETRKIGEPFTVICKIYSGFYEPTGVTTKSWSLSEIRMVDETNFQKLVDLGSSKKAEPKLTDLPAVTPSAPEEKEKKKP